MSGNDLSRSVPELRAWSTDAEKEAVALVVKHHATDEADYAELMDALGLGVKA